MTKQDLINAILDLDPEQDAKALARAKKAELEATLAAFEEAADDDETQSRMSKTLEKYRPKYKVCVAASGRKSLNNGDDLAALLSGLTHEEVLQLAEQALDLVGQLQERYGHLNHGQIRMNCGNRLRSAVKRGDLTVDEIANHIH